MKRGKAEDVGRTRGQAISNLLEMAKQTREQIINKDFEGATEKLSKELKAFSHVRYFDI